MIRQCTDCGSMFDALAGSVRCRPCRDNYGAERKRERDRARGKARRARKKAMNVSHETTRTP